MAHTSIISIVTVVDAAPAQIGATLRALHAVAHSLGSPFEVVLVANGCASAVLAQLRAEAATLDNLQIYVLNFARRPCDGAGLRARKRDR